MKLRIGLATWPFLLRAVARVEGRCTAPIIHVRL